MAKASTQVQRLECRPSNRSWQDFFSINRVYICTNTFLSKFKSKAEQTAHWYYQEPARFQIQSTKSIAKIHRRSTKRWSEQVSTFSASYSYWPAKWKNYSKWLTKCNINVRYVYSHAIFQKFNLSSFPMNNKYKHILNQPLKQHDPSNNWYWLHSMDFQRLYILLCTIQPCECSIKIVDRF
jgi:hypothetical protein